MITGVLLGPSLFGLLLPDVMFTVYEPSAMGVYVLVTVAPFATVKLVAAVPLQAGML